MPTTNDNKEKEQASVPFFVHEGMMTRMYRIIRILALLLVAALVIFVLNNIVWMKYVERQRAEMTVEEPYAAGVYEQSDTGDH